MKRSSQTVRVGYFGKLPTHGDFIKAADNLTLTSLLDDWLAGVMDQLSADPRWKLHYDAMAPLAFAFVGTRSRRAIAGRLCPSNDQSQRRYPLLAMSALAVDQPRDFVAHSPLVLAPLWELLTPMLEQVLEAAEPEPHLQALASTTILIDPGDDLHQQCFSDFLEHQSLAGLQAMLAGASVRQMMLALGLLLQPVRASDAVRLDKSFALPLPSPVPQRYRVAAFWLALIAPFLQQADLELSLLIGAVRGQMLLVLGFGGAAPHSLQAVIDPHYATEQLIMFDDTAWVEPLLAGAAAAQQLSAYLEQGQLSLRSAHALFHTTFAE